MKRFFFSSFFVHEREFDFCLFYNERLLIRVPISPLMERQTQTHWYTPPRCKGCKGKGSSILRCRVLSARSSQFWSQIALKCRKCLECLYVLDIMVQTLFRVTLSACVILFFFVASKRNGVSASFSTNTYLLTTWDTWWASIENRGGETATERI